MRVQIIGQTVACEQNRVARFELDADAHRVTQLGRVEEASELLLHSIQDDWPEDRRNWAGRFLQQHAEEGTAEFMFEIEPTLLH